VSAVASGLSSDSVYQKHSSVNVRLPFAEAWACGYALHLLRRLTETALPVALIDITGLPAIDTQTAQPLIETIKAVRYVGAEVVLTGVRPTIAQTLVHLGIDVSGVATRSSLNELVESVVSDSKRDAGTRKVTWIVARLPTVRGDYALLRHVFANLISNALKYSRRRNPAEIEICMAEHKGSEVISSVRDNGVGFDSNHADKLFGVFQCLHSDWEFEGTGIGLANVRRIVTRHGGRV
jgi:light-regulated signal transduction histidine kinase (bacteriophytochrome)